MRTLTSRLSRYDAREAQSIIRLLLSDLFGFTLADICGGALGSLSATERNRLEICMERLEQGEPVQYVTGMASFCGRRFAVRRGCLIPRPETEELCRWVVAQTPPGTSVLDIGTGCGCIAVTLKKELGAAEVSAWDISDDALAIATDNAATHNAEISFKKQDALTAPADNAIWDVIVSNPPYICSKEAADMENNVLDYEPHLALFVPDDDPLLFYRRITSYATRALKPCGRLFFEMNPLYAKEMAVLLSSNGLTDITIRKDFLDKDRFIEGRRRANVTACDIKRPLNEHNLTL